MDNFTSSLEVALKSSTTDESAGPRPNGSIISLIVGSLPIIILFTILISFKICYRICPHGSRQRRTELHVPRRTSTLSSMSRSSIVHHVGSSSSLHHNYASHHQHHPETLRADGTPLAHIELETIKEPEEEFDSEESHPLNFKQL